MGEGELGLALTGRASTGPTLVDRAVPCRPPCLNNGPSTTLVSGRAGPGPLLTGSCRARVGLKCRASGRAIVPRAAWTSIGRSMCLFVVYINKRALVRFSRSTKHS
jgi:hypothetical protein